jgi:23S rRNA (uracil1939-C5)-methyltransferase
MPEGPQVQAARKRLRVTDAFMGIAADIAETVCASQTLHYRSKATFVAKSAGKRGTILGAYRRGSHFVLDLEGCVIEERPIAQVASWLRQHVSRIPAFDEASGHGELRYVVMRSTSRGEVLVTLMGPRAAPPAWAKSLGSMMSAQLPFVRGISWAENGRPGNGIWRSSPVTIAGAPSVVEEVDGLRFVLSPRSFFQVHRAQASRLRKAMADALSPLAGLTVWDLFCGAGVNALVLAAHGARVHGVESVEDAVRDARDNATSNRLEASFSVHDLERGLPAGLPTPDAIVLNPPRKGASAALVEAIARMAPRKIVYIACAPKPVARAANAWIEHGYAVQSVIPFDLFPHTEHVETLAVFAARTTF